MTFSASQDSTFQPVDFSISTPLRNVRLMEVPDDLAGVIGGIDGLSGENGGKDRRRVRLKFKSSIPSTTSASASSKPKEGFVHLCSNDKIWTVKQVSTSNSVYVIQPATTTVTHDPKRTAETNIDSNDNDTEMTDTQPQHSENPPDHNSSESRRTITALSKVSNFLELQSLPINEQAIEQSIRDILPIYTVPNEFDDLPDQSDRDIALATATADVSTKQPVLMKNLLNNLPYPDDVIRKICRKLCGFEASETINNDNDNHKQDPASNRLMGRKQLFAPKTTRRRLLIPSLKAQLFVWRKIVDTCSIEGIPLHESITESMIERIADIPDDENSGPNETAIEGVNQGIVKALLMPPSLLPTTPTTEDSAIDNDTTTTTKDTSSRGDRGGGHFSETGLYDAENKLNPQQTTTWIATMLLHTFPFLFPTSSSAHDKDTSNDDNSIEATSKQIPLEIFVSVWTNLVPSATFVKYCTVSSLISSGVISGVRVREGDGVEVIDFRDVLLDTSGGSLNLGGSGGVGVAVGNGDSSTGGGSAGGKRKWHERLGGRRGR